MSKRPIRSVKITCKPLDAYDSHMCSGVVDHFLGALVEAMLKEGIIGHGENEKRQAVRRPAGDSVLPNLNR